MSDVRLFIATPLHDARLHAVYTAGLISAMVEYHCTWRVLNGTSLIRQRAMLVSMFAESDCTHLLWVDSDMSWNGDDVAALLATGRDFVGGTYCRKTRHNALTAHLLPNREGELYEATHVGTGFLLVSRAAVLKMLEAYAPTETFESAGKLHVSLFNQNIHEGSDDLPFCRRWRDIGGQVWMHTGVVLPHYDGNTAYVADVSELRKPYEAEQALAAE